MSRLINGLEGCLQKLFRFLLFISSYIPLFIILFLKNISNLKLSIMFILIIIIPLFIIKSYIDLPLKHEPNIKINIVTISHKGSEVLNYIVCYIIPFISFNSDVMTTVGIDIPNLLAVLILFLVICNLYMSSNLYYVNPVITLFYDIHSIEDNNGEILFLITEKKSMIPRNKAILTRRISPKVFLVTNQRKNKITTKKILILTLCLFIVLFIWNTDFHKAVLDVVNKAINFIVLVKKRLQFR